MWSRIALACLTVLCFSHTCTAQHPGAHGGPPPPTSNNTNVTMPDGGRRGPSILDYLEVRLAIDIAAWYLYILVPIGFTGNILAIITMALVPPLTTPAVNIIVLAVVDNLLLLSAFIYQVCVHQSVYLGTTGCVVLMYLIRASALVSNWQTVWIGIERAYAVLRPFKVGTVFTKKRALLIILCILVFSIGAYSPFTFLTKYDHESVGLKCGTKPEYTTFQLNYNVIMLTVEKILPVALLIVSSVVIVSGVRKAAKEKQKMQEGTKSSANNSSLTVMLATVTVTFLVLQSISVVYHILVLMQYRQYGLRMIVSVFLLRSMAHLLTDANHAINFFLYVLSGRVFREQFLKVFCCREEKSGK